ncbi:MAG TPA: hypothetical protein VGF63_01460 [Solirubrobacteraceae bacterium]|jgi:hypothetical protein
MDPIRVIYHEHPGDGRSAESPALPGRRIFGEAYGDTHDLAEQGVRFVLDCDVEERGAPAAASYPPIEHFVPVPA